jgi:hypothetical protein
MLNVIEPKSGDRPAAADIDRAGLFSLRTDASALPQLKQKRRSSLLSKPQFGQSIGRAREI